MNMQIAVSKFNTLSKLKQALLLSLVIGASSILSFKTPFMPVPWIVQNQIALLVGYVFGARVGFLAALAFLIEGAAGVPCFSFGRSGLGMILGPTGGYLLAYPVASAIAGYLKTKFQPKSWGIFAALFIANLVIYALGCVQLGFFVGFAKAMTFGLLPFIALDVFKTAVASLLLKKFSK